MAGEKEWVSFEDPSEHRTWVFDVTFLLSSWACIFGRGCQGVLTGPAPELAQGCCSYGAHFTDAADVSRVEAAAATLTADQWQFRQAGRRRGVVKTNSTGEQVTRMVDGACIFLNRPGFEGGPGCALHRAALERGGRPLDLKPDVCWQLPLRRTFRDVELPDGTEYTEVSIGEYDRRGWGPGGHDLDWYCSGNPEAHVAPEPLFVTSADELVALMGQGAYDELVVHCEAHLRSRSALAIHPADPRD
jgi:hypothetical protein